MKRQLKIWTARVDYEAIGEEVALNTTAKSAAGLGKVFAPTWELVMASKKKQITWQEYTEKYLNLLRERYAKNHSMFAEACAAGEIVLLCYCKNSVSSGKKCHRYLLAEVLRKVALSMGIQATYQGERLAYTNRPVNPK